MARCKDDINRLNDFNTKLAREKEELAKEKANLIVQLTATERENRSLSEEMAGLRYATDMKHQEAIRKVYNRQL